MMLLALSCVLPTERRGWISVEVVGVPDEVVLGDSLRATARVVDSEGLPTPNVPVVFRSSSADVLAVEPSGLVKAVGIGSAYVEASVEGYGGVDLAVRAVRVRGLIEIDSVRPDTVRFGDTLTIYAVVSGLDSASVFVGDVPAPVQRVARAGGRAETIVAVVPVFAPVSSTVSLRAGAATSNAVHAVTVIQEDLYEPNDSLPAAHDLGALPLGFFNSQLALERTDRNDAFHAWDFYVFRNATPRDRTFTFAGGADLWLSDTTLVSAWPHDSIVLDTLTGDTVFHKVDSVRTYSPRLFAGLYNRQFYWSGCGWGGGISMLVPDSVRVAFVGMSPSDYRVHLTWPAGRRLARYTLGVENGVTTALPPDGREGNDDCWRAPSIPFGGPPLSLNLHDLLDVDWLRFTLLAQGVVRIRADFPGPSLLDFSLFNGPYSTVGSIAVGRDAGPGIRELVVNLAAGEYLLALYSWHAVAPMPYTLTVGPGSAAALEAFRAAPSPPRRRTPSPRPGPW
jgi:hypothetical protein